MENTCRVIYERVDVKSVIWDVAASNVTASSAGSGAGRTQAVVRSASTFVAFRSFEFDVNAVNTKRKRALEVVLKDASGVDTDVVEGSALRSR